MGVGPCLCGDPACPRCFPGSWWHTEDCFDAAECECKNPHEYDLGHPEDYPEWNDDGR